MYLYSLDTFISNLRDVSGLFLIKEIPVLNANRIDPDQTPHSAVSDLGLYRMQMSILWDTRHKWVNLLQIYITKTYLYNFDPLKPHFYIVKLGFTGVYIIFLISA